MLFWQGRPTDRFRGAQQSVSTNICSEDLLSPTIFGLKCDENLNWSKSLHTSQVAHQAGAYLRFL